MNMKRLLKHLAPPPWLVRRAFAPSAMRAIESAIAAGELRHLGQIRFAVEETLTLAELWRGKTARERALEVFADLRVWDTEQNNGVLVYLLLADRDVEIVADRGIHRTVGEAAWEEICRAMEAALHAGQFETGVVRGIEAIGALLAAHYPRHAPGTNELPNAPVVL
ncbi:MAG: TPM domain-containing protein [Hydrogenophilales bacterium]|nr:TPM domain-containing protein [Hydrogenophilales bacterium]